MFNPQFVMWDTINVCNVNWNGNMVGLGPIHTVFGITGKRHILRQSHKTMFGLFHVNIRFMCWICEIDQTWSKGDYVCSYGSTEVYRNIQGIPMDTCDIQPKCSVNGALAPCCSKETGTQYQYS